MSRKPDSDKPKQEPGWEAATWEGARLEAMRRWAAMPLEEIVAAQEEMHALAEALGHRPMGKVPPE
jgi:hypothetical protein